MNNTETLQAVSAKSLNANLIDHMIKVLIVDDEAIIRTGLKKILAEHASISVVGEASSGEEAERLAASTQPNVILMDITMPGQGGIETTKNVLNTLPHIRVLALSVHCDEHYPSQILNAGAHGYITKGVNAQEMIDAIKQVATGNAYICHAVAQKIKSKQLLGRDRLFECLNDIELVICAELVMGENLDTIAKKQTLSKTQAQKIRKAIFEKLNIDNEVALIHLAIRNGLLDKDSPSFN